MSRDRILDAAASVFAGNGYHRTRMDDIALAAGVAKGTLYYHFPGKADLFRALATEGLEMLLRETKTALDANVPFVEQLRLVLDRTISLYMEYDKLAQIFFNELTSGLDAEVRSDIEAVQARFQAFLAELLQEGNQYGSLKVPYPALTAAGLIGLLDGMCRLSLRYPEKHTAEQVKESMLALLIGGLAVERK